MTKDEKKNQAEALHRVLEKAKCVILSGFEGLKVAQDAELRRKLGQAGARYQVVKNSLIGRAAQGTPTAAAAQKLRGTTSLAYTEADPVALAKALTAYAKENPALVFKAGVVEGRVVSLAEMAQISNLPSRIELLAKALFLINAPAQHLAMTLAGVARSLVSVVNQAVKEKKFAEAKVETGN
jgi:large subunit ribosomal protein L10